jgi:hypothetical protein
VPRLRGELRLFGWRLHLDAGLAPVEGQSVLERIEGVRFEVDSPAHRDAVARAQANEDARRAAAAQIVRDAVARAAEALEGATAAQAHLDEAVKQINILEAQRDVAQVERQRLVENMEQVELMLGGIELNRKRAN